MKRIVLSILIVVAVAAAVGFWNYTHPTGVEEAFQVVGPTDGTHFAIIKFFPNNKHTKAYLKVDVLSADEDLATKGFIVRQIDVWLHVTNSDGMGGEDKGLGYYPVDVKDLFDGGVAAVIDEDLFYAIPHSTSMHVVLTSTDGGKITYKVDPRRFDLANVRFLERAVQGERRS